MNKKELIERLYDERGIYILTPSNLKIARRGSKLWEVYYTGKIHIDHIDKKFAVCDEQ